MANKFKVDLANLFTNWSDDVGGWATLTGGVVITPHPVAGDAAIADGNSGNIVVNVSSACSSFTATAAYARTMSGSAALSLTGVDTVWEWDAGTLTYSGQITLTDSSGSECDFFGGGKTYGSLVTVAGNFCFMIGTNTFGSITSNGGIALSESQTVTGLFQASGDVDFGGVISHSFGRVALLAGGPTALGTTIALTGTGPVWTASAGLVNPSFINSIITISDTSSTGKIFAGGGLTYNALTITGSAGDVTFTGNNTFAGTFTSGASPLDFYGTTTTFSGTVTLTGCKSITGGNWVKTSGTVTAPSGCRITNNHASGGATFTATAAINDGGNTGWNFGTTPQPTDGQTGLMSRWLQWGRHISRFARRVR